MTTGKINSMQDACHSTLPPRMSPASTPPRQEPAWSPSRPATACQGETRLPADERSPTVQRSHASMGMADLRYAGNELRLQRYDPDGLLDFVVGVESQSYPRMGKRYRRRIEAAARQAK